MYVTQFCLCALLIQCVYVFSFNRVKNIFLLFNCINSVVSNTGNFFIDIYFRTLFIFCFINLFCSIFNIYNFINMGGDYLPIYCFTVTHTVFCIIYGLFRLGPVNLFLNFYVVRSNNFAFVIMGFIISVLLFIIDICIKPFIIATRLILNVYVGNSLHAALSSINGGIFFIVLLNCFKVAAYVLQSYLFYIFRR